MITPSFGLTATERVLPRLALDFTTASLDSRITFTRTTGASNPATYIDSFGVITAATNNQPRFDYDPVTLVCKGLLIEESRTNSLLNSDTLSTQSVTVTAAARTLSFYGTGQIVLSGAHSATVTGTGAYPTRTTLTFTPIAGTLTLTVTGTVQYAQLEAGAFATSYIPTTTTALTRNADVATMTGTNFSSYFADTVGTVQTEYTPATVSGFRNVLVTALNGSRRFVYQNNTTAQSYDGTNVVAASGSLTANAINKVAMSYGAGGIRVACNGNTVGSGSFAGSFAGSGQLWIGYTQTNSEIATGWFRKLSAYPYQLTAAQVQALSK